MMEGHLEKTEHDVNGQTPPQTHDETLKETKHVVNGQIPPQKCDETRDEDGPLWILI